MLCFYMIAYSGRRGQWDFWLLSDFCFRYVIGLFLGLLSQEYHLIFGCSLEVCIPDICATGIKFLHFGLSQPQVPIHLLVSELLPPLPLRHATKSGSLAAYRP